MIIRMAKVEIIGPRHLLMEVLTAIRELGIMEIETEGGGFIGSQGAPRLTAARISDRDAAERLVLGELRAKIADILACLPPLQLRESYLEPATVIDTIAAGVERHGKQCRELQQQREGWRRERGELERYTDFMATVGTLVGRVEAKSGLDFIGITLRDPLLADQVRDMVARVTDGRYEMVTAEESGGGLIALITTPREIAAVVREALSGERLPELPFPSALADLPFVARVQRLREKLDDLAARIAAVDAELERFARRWGALYRRVHDWLDERLSLLQASATVRETGMCFVVRGWIAAAERERLVQALNGRFGGQVVVTEKRILEQDLERVPVLLRNPPYFRPFEIFTRLLPLPRYGSYDPTPFIAIFFPLFFGMMLGDAGHGLLLILIALGLKRWCRKRPLVMDAARVLLVSASYAVIFGFLYGEFFGELGESLFGLRPLWLARGKAIMPMLWFTIAIGTAHVLLGLVLGFLASLRKKTGKEALSRLVNIVIIILLAALAVSVVIPSPWLLTRPILVTTALLIPFLFVTGGLLAPLELLKNIGNIISYTRIMAIGLSCVLLANAANRLAGISGDIIIGTLAAVLLHGISLVLGVFAPTIHGLRLHFVEFFSKFLEHGGREFTPLKKKHQN